MASKKDQAKKLSRIEQEAIKDVEKAFGIKIYTSRQELQKALKKLGK